MIGNNSSFEFKKFDRDQIEKEIDLEKKAEKDGSLGIPPANAKEKSKAEQLALKKSRAFLDSEIKRANNWLGPIIKKINDLVIKIERPHWSVQEAENKVEENKEQASTTLETEELIFHKEEKDVESFRKLHSINRQPKITTLTTAIVQIGIVILLFTIESFVNMELLATAIGKKEGLAYSTSVAGLNVLLSAIVGYFVLKGAINYESGSKKKLLDLFMYIYVTVIIYINCCLGAIRAIYDKTEEQVSVSGLSIGDGINNALLFWTVDWNFQSLVLTFIGVLFALISLIDAYLFKDVYPGYGDIAKKREQSRKKIRNTIENISNAIVKIFNHEHSKGNIDLKELTNRDLVTLNGEYTEVTKLFSNYSNLAYSVQRGVNEMFETYRGLNGQVRADGVRPEYWNNKYVMDEHYLNPELKFPNCKGYYFPGNTIQAKIVDVQTQLKTKHNKFVEDLNEYRKKVDQWILELKKRYELS